MTKVPTGFTTISPALVFKDAVKAIEFYKKAFGAIEVERYTMPDGKIGHARLKLGDSNFFLCDEFHMGNGPATQSPLTLNGTTVTIHLYVEDADSFFENALKAGAETIMPVSDTFWGDRFGKLMDPFGYHWSIATQKEQLTHEEIKERMKACFQT